MLNEIIHITYSDTFLLVLCKYVEYVVESWNFNTFKDITYIWILPTDQVWWQYNYIIQIYHCSGQYKQDSK